MAAAKPLPPVTVTFLGTCSGGGPIASRNCSSLAIDFGIEIWLVDCADGTLPRLFQSSLKLSKITRVFITHMHADHVLGLVSLMTTVMSGVGMDEKALSELKDQGVVKKAKFHIYGPKGIRELIRTTLRLTAVALGGAYAVHELLSSEQPSVECGPAELHANEAVGRDIQADSEGVWRTVAVEGEGKAGKSWGVSAGPIEHRIPCIGYIFQEPTPRLALDTASLIPLLQANAIALRQRDPPVHQPLSLLSYLTSLPPFPVTLPSGEILQPPGPSGIPPRKFVIFGDCSGGTKNSTFQEMCRNPSLLVHECTNSAVPELVQRGDKGRKVRMRGMDSGLVANSEKQTGKPVGAEKHDSGSSRLERDRHKIEEVRRKAQSRGHSAPQDVGAFARTINPRRVVVNHFSAMFPSPRYPTSEPLPSLLSPQSPYPYPVANPPTRTGEPPLAPTSLTGAELHLRLILQALVDGIADAWACESQERLVVASRDFMTIRIPAHELDEQDILAVSTARVEAAKVMSNWTEAGGIWTENPKVWIGVESPPEGS